MESEHNTTLKGREEIADFLASEESISAKESLYKKYAEQQVKTFPGETVQRSASTNNTGKTVFGVRQVSAFSPAMVTFAGNCN